ncbi:MAG: polymer-forming cytoskeletal protein [Kiritimatiellae bacterium]|nr:polymer-forming cytoskeletal protein [Kiritimatiellia bacterium]
MEQHMNSQSVISSETEITGTVKTSGAIQIDGKLNGDLESGGDATIGKSANIKGNLAINSITISGTVNGNITAKDRIEMTSTARVTGDIKAKRLAVEDGVTFVGKSEVNPSGSSVSSGSNTSKNRVDQLKEDNTAPEGKGAKTGVFSKR